MPRREDTARCLDRYRNTVDQLDKLIDGTALFRSIYSKDLANQLGVSVRTLQSVVKIVRGTTLHGYLRRKRLSAARARLQRGAGSVKGAALESGFWQLSDFAREYQKLFGELPSSTLRLARARAVGDTALH